MTKCCGVSGCGRAYYASGLCRRHYDTTDKAKAKRRDRLAASPASQEKNRATTQAWREVNRNRDRENARKYREAHPEKARAAVKRWEQANPDRCAHYRGQRKARLRSGGHHSQQEWRELCFLYQGVCPRCKRAVKRFSLDHIVPISKGGSNWIWNVQPLCRSCNSSKKANPEGFYPPPCYNL